MASATGTATVDFGSFPGANVATVTVTGQASISSTSHVEAFFMAETTADHTVNDHRYVAFLAKPVCTVPIASTGFDINVVSDQKLQGTFKLRWVWAD